MCLHDLSFFSLIELNARLSSVFNTDKLALQLNCKAKQSLIRIWVSECHQRRIFSLSIKYFICVPFFVQQNTFVLSNLVVESVFIYRH